MTSIIIPTQSNAYPRTHAMPFVTLTPKKHDNDTLDARVRESLWQQLIVNINIQTEVMDADVVRRKTNVWLLTHAGNLLGAENPELILGEPIQWRFDIRLSLPDANLSNPLITDIIGKIHCNAQTGEPLIPESDIETFVKELQTHADRLVIY